MLVGERRLVLSHTQQSVSEPRGAEEAGLLSRGCSASLGKAKTRVFWRRFIHFAALHRLILLQERG